MVDRPSVRQALENRLMGQGIYLTSWDRNGEILAVEYEVVVDHTVVTSDEVGRVVRTILEVVEEYEEWTVPGIRATSLTTDGATRGSWQVEREWFELLHDDLSEVEFSGLVLETIEHAGEQPRSSG